MNLTATTLALQALIERLAMSGSLSRSDLDWMRDFGLVLADAFRDNGNSHVQVSAERIEGKVRAFWDSVGTYLPPQPG